MRDRRVGELIVSAELLPVTTYHETGFVTHEVPIAVTFQFEYIYTRLVYLYYVVLK